MNSEVTIIGAGTGGLTTAYWLLKHGINVSIIEREQQVGGLMRPVKYKDFMVDFGYKHLYTRIPEVYNFWKEILEEDFLPYNSRIGILYKGHILEREKTFKGLKRGMPYQLLLTAFFDFLKNSYHYYNKSITSLEDYSYSRRGEKFTRIFSQEYDERFKGQKWSQLPAPKTSTRQGFWLGFLQDAIKTTQKQDKWFHPAKGTGQIVEMLEQKILEMGGKIYLGYQVSDISHKNGLINSIEIRKEENTIELTPSNTVSSLPIQILAQLMGLNFNPSKNELSFQRGVILVYLFIDKPVTFSHISLHVSCPSTLMSRITNFGAYEGSMVPKGKGCLCIEYFSTNSKELFLKNDKALFELAIDECEKSGLLNKKDCSEFLVLRGLKADPAVSFEDYVTDATRKDLYNQVSNFNNLYQINRTGTDKSTYAGIMAAKAIINNNKTNFDLFTNPELPSPWEL